MTDDIAPPQDHLLIQLLTKQCLKDVALTRVALSISINLGQHAVKVIFLDKLDAAFLQEVQRAFDKVS